MTFDLDLTKSPEFMAALEKAILAAAAELSREAAARVQNPEEIWLTAKEAREYLRMADSTWYDFKAAQEKLLAHEREIVISYSIAPTSPRYQLASLQRFMRKGAVGLPDPLPGMSAVASTRPPAKQRGVSLRPAGAR